MAFLFGAAGPTVRGFNKSELFTFALVPQTVSSSTGGTPGSFRDAVTSVVSGATVDSVFSVQMVDSTTDPGTVVTNLTPAIATFSGPAAAAWVSNGIAQVQASHPVYGARVLTIPVSRAVSNSTAFEYYGPAATTSLAADLSSLIDNGISGVTCSDATTSIWRGNGNLATNTRNSNLWCASLIDLTGLTREVGATFTTMSLIGPHHLLTAAHIAPGVGTIGWVGSDGVGYVGTVVSHTTITGLDTYNGQTQPTDLAICYVRDATSAEISAYNAANPGSKAATQPLSAAFTGSPKIKPMALFPASTWAASGTCQLPMTSYLGYNYTGNTNAGSPPVPLVGGKPVPVMHFGKGGNVGVWDIFGQPISIFVNGTSIPFENEFIITQSALSNRAPFSTQGGTNYTASGDVSFTAIPAGSTLATNNPTLGAGYPIILGTNHDGGSLGFGAPWSALYIAGITTAMQSLAQAAGDPNYASYAPIVLSLTGYSSY